MRISVFIFGILLLAGRTVAGEGDVSWLGANLVPDSGFEQKEEEAAKAGNWQVWTARKSKAKIERVRDRVLEGTQSLRMSCPDSPSNCNIRTKMIPVTGGKTYLFSVSFRQEGFNFLKEHKSKYAGVSSSCSIQWFDKDKKQTGRTQAIGFPYGSCLWDLRDLLVTAPQNAAYVIIGAGMSNQSVKEVGKTIPSTVWLDAVQLREYRRLPTPEWAKGESERVVDGVISQSPVRSFFLASDKSFHSRGGKWSKVVVDNDAERGGVLMSPANAGPGIMIHSPYFRALTPGLYRLRARIKISNRNAAEQVGYLDIASQLAANRLVLNIWPKMFKKSGEYQDFEVDFIVRSPGWWCLRVYTKGNQPWWIDSVKVFPLEEFQDRQLISVYPASKGQIKDSLAPRQKKPLKILIVAGIGYDTYRLVNIFRLLEREVDIAPVWVKKGRAIELAGFPESAEELFDYSMISICNVSVKAFTLLQKHQINEFVKRGGALLLLGGHQSYERGDLRGSLIEDAIPVVPGDRISENLIISEKGMPLKLKRDIPWTAEADFAAGPLVFFMHDVKLKKDAKLFAEAGGHPFLVGGDYGKGRVLCVLGMPYGNPRDGQTGFWQWNDWIYMMRNAVLWALRQEI